MYSWEKIKNHLFRGLKREDRSGGQRLKAEAGSKYKNGTI